MTDKALLSQIEEITRLILSIEDGKLFSVAGSSAVIIEEMKKQKSTLITKYVDSVHRYKISPPTDKVKFYVTRMQDGRKLRAVSLDELYMKLFKAYGGESRFEITFERVFYDALDEKSKLRDQNTVYKYSEDYKRFITKKLASTPIKRIDNKLLKEYTIDLVNRLKLTPKAYASYKGVLNLAFNYAVATDLIDYNIANKLVDSDYKARCKHEFKSAEEKAMAPEQIAEMTAEVWKRISAARSENEVYTTGYMFLLSSLTGMREGELCSLKWTDVEWESMRIHIHTQQRKVGKEYVFSSYTKNEKGIPKGGRHFPITQDVKTVLNNLAQDQKRAGISSAWVFCDKAGEWIKKDSCYDKFLRRLCKNLGFTITNNHAIRMYFNSYVLIPKGVTVADRARLLGHSVDVNLRNYSFSDHNYCDNAGEILDGVFVPKEDPLGIEKAPGSTASQGAEACTDQVSVGVQKNVVSFDVIKARKAR